MRTDAISRSGERWADSVTWVTVKKWGGVLKGWTLASRTFVVSLIVCSTTLLSLEHRLNSDSVVAIYGVAIGHVLWHNFKTRPVQGEDDE